MSMVRARSAASREGFGRPAVVLLVAFLTLVGCGSKSGSITPSAQSREGTTALPAPGAAAGRTSPPLPAGGGRPLIPVASGPNRSSGGLTLLTEPEQGLGPVYSLLAGATRTLDMAMYQLADPHAEQILASDAGRGVLVRVILDGRNEGRENAAAYAYLAARGVHVLWASPAFSYFHEKAVVVDVGQPDQRSLVMTLNLTSRYYLTSRDFAVIDSQPADVDATERVFDDDYQGQSSFRQPPGDDLLWSPGSGPALVALIDSARRSLTVENEEMSAPEIIDALMAASRRGVVVEVVMTAGPDWDAAFRKLRAAGVRVRTYPDLNTELYIHAKAVVADATSAYVGSENFSDASLDHDRELGFITRAPEMVAGLAAVLSSDFAGATSLG
jgi:cardiolipin synthase A/B